MSLKRRRRCLCYLTAVVILTIIVGFIALSSQDSVVFMWNQAVSAPSDMAIVSLNLPALDQETSKTFRLKEPTADTTWILTNSSVDVRGTSCTALIAGSGEEQKRATEFMDSHFRVPILPDDYIRWTRDCQNFRSQRKYIMEALPEEVDFPLAFSLLMYKDVEQAERLLRAVYRPHNYVCIHVDGKADSKVKDAMAAIASCLPGVFVHPKPVKVSWSKFTVLEADLICMKALLALRKWRYFINLTGQEFPLKTNLQLVRILRAYNGANDVNGYFDGIEKHKTRWIQAGPLPAGLSGVIGPVHVAVNREWVHYALTNSTAALLLEWVKKTKVPDETFFATLNHNQKLRVPGGYSGKYRSDPEIRPYLARYKIWDYDKTRCRGKFFRKICIFAIGDLPVLTALRELIANKFFVEFSPLTLDCMEKWYFHQVEEELRSKGGNSRLDVCWYRTRGFVEHHFPLSSLSSDRFLLPDLYSVTSSSAWEGGHTDATTRQH